MRVSATLLLLFCGPLIVVAEDAEYKVEKLDKLPDGLSAEVTKVLQPNGLRVRGKEKTVCDVWLARKVPLRKGFEKSFNVAYPFLSGQLIGVVRVPAGSVLTDFRGQEIKAGVYTLRYGQQPEDGNHIGTSETADFLLALPAQVDKSPKPLQQPDNLSTRSQEAAGSTHPAIFSLLPVQGDKAQHGTLTHEKSLNFVILNAHVPTGEKPVPVRLVVIGKSDA